MVALSFGCTTHQMKFHLAREGNFIGLQVEFFIFFYFPLEAAKQAAAAAATVLRHYAKIFEQYELEVKDQHLHSCGPLYICYCVCVHVCLYASPHGHLEQLFPERCLISGMKGLWRRLILSSLGMSTESNTLQHRAIGSLTII